VRGSLSNRDLCRGEELTRAGVNVYLKQHQYANATADDFWDAQAKTSKKPVWLSGCFGLLQPQKGAIGNPSE
jgi:aminopeptidase N